MMISNEVLLATGILIFYLYDSMALLYLDEFALIEKGGTWSYVYPSQKWTILKRFLFVPNPLRPDAMVFVVSWNVDAQEEPADPRRLRVFRGRLAFLRQAVIGLLLVVCGIVPVAILVWKLGSFLLLMLVLAYGFATLAACSLLRHRKALQLSSGQALSIVLECLLCPPIAVNVVRKVCRGRKPFGDPLLFARGALDPLKFNHLVGEICARIDFKLELMDEVGGEHAELTSLKQRIQGMMCK